MDSFNDKINNGLSTTYRSEPDPFSDDFGEQELKELNFNRFLSKSNQDRGTQSAPEMAYMVFNKQGRNFDQSNNYDSKDARQINTGTVITHCIFQDNVLSGNIIPDRASMYDLGSPEFPLRAVYADNLSSGGAGGRMFPIAGQIIPNSSDTKVALNTASLEEGVICDTTNFRITAIDDGVYMAIAQVTYADPVANKILQAMIYVNGSMVTQGQWVTSSIDMLSVQISWLGSLLAGEFIELNTFHNCGGSELIQGDINTFLQVIKV